MRPASCILVSGEYIAAKRRAGLNNCNGSTMKFRPTAIAMIAAVAPRKRKRLVAAMVMRYALEPEVNEFRVLLDAENPERQHGCSGIEEPGPHPITSQLFADDPLLVIVTHNGLRVGRQPGDR